MNPTLRALAALAIPCGLAVALTFVGPSCSSGSSSSGGCVTNADCPSTAVCNHGQCFLNRGNGGSSGGASTTPNQGSSGGSGSGNNGSTGSASGWTSGGSGTSGGSASSSACLGWPNCSGATSTSSSGGTGATTCSCSTSCCSIDEGSAPSGTQCPGTTKYCYGQVPDGGDFFCNLQDGKCDPFDPCSGASGTYTCQSSGGGSSGGSSSGGTVTVDPSGLSFVLTGDTRPNGSGDPYPTSTVNAIYTDFFTTLSPKPMAVIATGDYQEEGDSDPTAEIDDYEAAIALFAPYGPTYPAMGNHECVSTSITTSCAVSGANSSNNTSAFTAYMQMMSDLTTQHPSWFPASTNGQPYYYETLTAPNGDSAKFVITAANAWDSTQNAWLGNTLAIPSTFTFLARHEPDTATGCTDSTANDNTTSNCDFIAQVQTAINAATVPVTLKLEGHTHWIHFDTTNDAIVSGAGGVSIESGCTASDDLYCNYGYVWCQELTNKTFQCTAYDWQSGPVMTPATPTYPSTVMRFIAANGSPNPGTLSYAN